MPISDHEWDDGSTDATASEDPTTPVGEYDDEAELVVSFLSENVDNAYTRTEIVRGVDFGDHEDPESVSEALREAPAELVDAAGDLTASAMLVDDIDEVLDTLVTDGTVAEREVATDDGTTTYYRLNTGDAND